jgi:uncharacterized protein YggE
MKSKYHLTIMIAATAAVVLLLAGLIVGLAGFNQPVAAAQTTPEAPAGRSITVVGEGKVRAKPDIAQAGIGVEIINVDVKQASDEAAAAMQNIMDALIAQGVAENDIQTSYFNIWVERPYAPDGSQSNQTIYHVSNTVNVTIRDLSKVTTTLGAAIEAGANTINSITFNIADPAELQGQARQQAVNDAQAKAQELAGLNGVTLGEVVQVSEVVPVAGPLFDTASYAQGVGGGGVGPISPGEIEVTVQLQVSYAIQ